MLTAVSAALSDPEILELEPVLFRLALRATRDRELAHDLAQDALLVAVAERATFVTPNPLTGKVLTTQDLADGYAFLKTRSQ